MSRKIKNKSSKSNMGKYTFLPTLSQLKPCIATGYMYITEGGKGASQTQQKRVIYLSLGLDVDPVTPCVQGTVTLEWGTGQKKWDL